MYNTDASGRLAQAWDAETQSEFHITITYDGPQAANSALNVYRHIQKQFGRDLRIHRTILNFEAIRRGKTSEQRRSPDMVVVASHSAGPLPSFFTQWLSQELSEAAERPVALVAIVESGSARQPTPVYCHLKELAAAAGASFFHNQISLPQPPETPAAAQPHPEDRWGLNEC